MKNRIILITVDCLRKDHIGLYNSSKKITPNIDKLGLYSTVFTNAITNGPCTPPAMFSIFTSKIPAINGPYIPLSLEEKTFVKLIKKKNIKSAIIHSNPYLSKGTNYEVDFDDCINLLENPSSKLLRRKAFFKKFKNLLYHLGFSDEEIMKIKYKIYKFIKPIFNKTQLLPSYADASTTTQAAINWLKKNYNSSFFLWIHYMDPHYPHYPINNFIRSKFTSKISNFSIINFHRRLYEINKNPSVYNKKEEDFVNLGKFLYKVDVNYVDLNLGILFQFLRKNRIYDDSNIILTADHGEGLFEHTFIGHMRSLYDELLKIPLIIKWSKKNHIQRVDKIVSLIDLAPTILDIYEITPPKEFVGNNLIQIGNNSVSSDNGNYAISAVFLTHFKDYKVDIFCNSFKNHKYFLMISCRDKNWKLIYYDKKKEYSFFNLKKDPNELNNLINARDKEINEDIEYSLNVFKNKLEPYINLYHSEKEILKRIIKRIF